jgi:hypothetical protein
MRNKKDVVKEQKITIKKAANEQLSSLEMLWEHAYQELDAWAERLDYQDEILLNAAKKYVEKATQNRENIRAITEQFNRELLDWEATAREEFLMTTTLLQQFFPKNSYHEINQVMDEIHTKTKNLVLTPINAIVVDKAIEKYLQTVEQYVTLRKESRQEYIKNIKQTSNLFYENQKLLFNAFTKQLKTAFFPFQKYMENTR